MMKNKTKNEKIVECPECLGLGVVYTPSIDQEETCQLCRGKGRVEETTATLFDPLKGLEELENEIENDTNTEY